LASAAALAQFDVPVSVVSLGQRLIYAESAARGLSVLEVEPHSEAAKEITRLAHTLTGGPPVDALAREKAA
jgi:chromosome partitioning protein